MLLIKPLKAKGGRYLVGLGLAVVVELDVVVDVFALPVLALVVVVVVVVVVVALLVLPVFEVDPVLVIVEVLLAIDEVFVLVLLALLAVVLSLPPQAAPSAPIARTAESAITFFIIRRLLSFSKYPFPGGFPAAFDGRCRELFLFRGKR